ncbi:hypothetical protein VPHD479_0130 [Vibrio phage D479]
MYYSKHLIVKAVDAIHRNTPESELAWHELTNHHAIPHAKEGMYLLERFWLGYSMDPWENYGIAQEEIAEMRADAGYDEHTDSGRTNDDAAGMLGVEIANYIRKHDPSFDDWSKVLIDVTW